MEVPVEPKYTGLPRRYEDTKPALDQVFTHTNILHIGEKILEKFQENSCNEKDDAVKLCEKQVWKEAEEYKDACVREALEQAAKEEALRVKELEKIHSMRVEHEVERIRELMRQQCVEERYEERKYGEKCMAEMGEELRRQYEIEKMAEVKAARIEEQGIAENASQDMMRRHEEAMRTYGEEMEEAKNSELAALRYDLEDRRLECVKRAREEEQEAAEVRMNTAKASHQVEIDTLKESVRQLNNEKSQLELDLNTMTRERDMFIEKYNTLKAEFTSFIEHCRSDFGHGQADFLLPPN